MNPHCCPTGNPFAAQRNAKNGIPNASVAATLRGSIAPSENGGGELLRFEAPQEASCLSQLAPAFLRFLIRVSHSKVERFFVFSGADSKGATPSQLSSSLHKLPIE